jgi:6-phosphogluconate dehydrogenase
MHVGMIGLGKMGGNMAVRLIRGGHAVVGTARGAASLVALERAGGTPAADVAALVAALPAPRAIWIMVPAGAPTDEVLDQLATQCAPGDVIVDGGNSYYKDSVRRGEALAARGIHFLDCGTSGGVWGLTEGYCLMVGGPKAAFDLVEPALTTLAPPEGVRHLGAAGAGHYSKMVHNAIEYGMMQAYAEGFAILQASDLDIDVRAGLQSWQHGSVVRSWLLDLLVRALEDDPVLADIAPVAADSGEGRWTVEEAIHSGVAAPVISAALFARFVSQDADDVAMRAIAALRNQFGGHAVLPSDDAGAS